MTPQSPDAKSGLTGKPLDRVDGRLKVTGGAKYAADFHVPNLAHAVMVRSTATKGRIVSIDTGKAARASGVLAVLTHENAPKLPYLNSRSDVVDPEVGETLRMLQDDRVHFNGQPIAVVVAETLEAAEHAAHLVTAQYETEQHAATMKERLAGAIEPSAASAKAPPPRGDARAALQGAATTVDVTLETPLYHNNPLGLLATIAEWNGGKLTLHDTSQWVYNVRDRLAGVFGMDAADVQVICPFTGGAFGCTLRTWGHVVLAAMAAQVVKRPVKLVLSRRQMFTSNGYRPETRHRVQLGADGTGKLAAISHEAFQTTSRYEEYTEAQIHATRFLYGCEHVDTPYKIVPVDMSTPTWMRAPGECTGVFALETAMDELAYKLKIDPVELRLKNYPARDLEKNQAWSSNSLRECLSQGAKLFGWNRRKFEPASMREGNHWVGWGVASATYPANRSPASATATVYPDGTALVRSGTTDIGVGTYTAMTQIAADALGLPIEKVRFELGNSVFPNAPPQGGSQITASVGNAVHEAALAVRGKILALAANDEQSPLYGAKEQDITAQNSRLVWKNDLARGEAYAKILKRNNHSAPVEATVESKPPKASGEQSETGDKRGAPQYSSHAFGARFCEVRVDRKLGIVRVTRFLSVIGAGRVVNLKQAQSQIKGGTVMGIGMALVEGTVIDPIRGWIATSDLASYHVPTHADIPELDLVFVDERDERVNPLGIKGLGEVAIVGVAAAVANAVFHATGQRVRDLPITPDKLLEGV